MAKEDNDEFESVYDDESRDELVEDDKISPEEGAFMSGYYKDEEKKDTEDEDKHYESAFEEKKK